MQDNHQSFNIGWLYMGKWKKKSQKREIWLNQKGGEWMIVV